VEFQVGASHVSRSGRKNFASLSAFQLTSSLCADTSKGHIADLDGLFQVTAFLNFALSPTERRCQLKNQQA
jgi:hypothetical protein